MKLIEMKIIKRALEIESLQSHLTLTEVCTFDAAVILFILLFIFMFKSTDLLCLHVLFEFCAKFNCFVLIILYGTDFLIETINSVDHYYLHGN